jgi:hypothetical protein
MLNIYKGNGFSCQDERFPAEENATVLTVSCYGTMWDRTIKLPAYACLGFARFNNLGLGGISVSDLRSAMTPSGASF